MTEGKKQRSAGRFAEALLSFETAARIAHDTGDAIREGTSLVQLGSCEGLLFRYRAALGTYRRAQLLANQASDSATAGSAAIGMAEVYKLLGDYGLAEKKQREALQLLSGSSNQEQLARGWRLYADTQMRQGKIAAGKQSFDKAIEFAKAANRPDTEALAWDYRGISLLRAGDITGAEQAINNAYTIYQRIHHERLSLTTEHQAELELKKGNYPLALQLVDKAFATAGPTFKSSPQYYPIHIRGQILLGLGRKSEALAEFRRAVDAANSWRQGAMPGDTSSTQTVAFLHHVYQDYAELAAELVLERHDNNLSRQAFEALATNRAASLREQLTVSLSRNLRLPDHYFDLLSQLQSAQAQITLQENTPENEAKASRIRLELSELENEIGIENPENSHSQEKNRLQNSLRNIQSSLGRNEVLLSFCLGEHKSFLWAISGDFMNLYRLPPENEIGNRVKELTAGIRSHQNLETQSLQLSKDLFGNLTPAIWQKRDWIITGDGVLLNGIPFSALRDLSFDGRRAPLIANHTLRQLPTELLLLSAKPGKPELRFVGVGDPIYNQADSRRASAPVLLPAKNSKSSVALGRLVGSGREISASAKQSGLPDVQLLTGREANGTALRAALARTPAVLHFAVHVVSPDGQPDEAALALSLTRDSVPELLTREAIPTYRVPGSLVVLSGCSSDQGRPLPSAGLIGLSRAWLLAGATAVLVTAWPTADNSSPFFSAFYNHLRVIQSGSVAARAAAALQQTQLEMQHGSGYQRLPLYWGAYSIVSKE